MSYCKTSFTFPRGTSSSFLLFKERPRPAPLGVEYTHGVLYRGVWDTIRCFVVILVLLSISCVGNVTVKDVVSEEYFYETVFVNKSLQDICKSIDHSSYHCKPYPWKIVLDPDNPARGRVVFSFMENPNSIVVVVDLAQINDSVTRVDSYTYLRTWRGVVDRLIRIIDSPSNCDQ